MNKPIPILSPENDFGALDANGQQVWSPAETAAIARMDIDPTYLSAIEAALADERAGKMISHEELAQKAVERRRRWSDDRLR